MQVDTNTQVAIHSEFQSNFKYSASPTIEKIIALSPKFILGESHLFCYDASEKKIVPSLSFQQLLKLLVELGELDSTALTANSIHELNGVLQKAQGQGGLLRKEGSERWDLHDNTTKQQYRPAIEKLLQELGFNLQKKIDGQINVNHCIIFGARTERMERRIKETLQYLGNNLHVMDHLFLLGSNRKLVAAEIQHIKEKFASLEEPQRSYWDAVFADENQCTEANAFVFLWRCLVPGEMQKKYEDKLVGINSTRIGFSYHESQGHRPTTEVTTQDWLAFYKSGELQSIFALAEQPYLRLADQLRATAITKGKKAGIEEIIDRIAKTTFFFASETSEEVLLSIVFDEIARHLYRMKDTLEYLEKQ